MEREIKLMGASYSKNKLLKDEDDILFNSDIHVVASDLSLHSSANEKIGFVYNVLTKLENELSSDKITLNKNQISNTLDVLLKNKSLNVQFLNSNFNSKKIEFINSYNEKYKSDFDILNGIVDISNDKKSVINAFYDVGKFTHTRTDKNLPVINMEKSYIIFKPENIEIKKISEISNFDFDIVNKLNSKDEIFYCRVCSLLSNDFQSFKLSNENKILFNNFTIDDTIYNSFKELFENEFRNEFIDSLDSNIPIKDILGKNCFDFIKDQSNVIFKDISINNSQGKNNDGVSKKKKELEQER